MTEDNSPPGNELEDILRRLEAARLELADALNSTGPERFERENAEGESIKKLLERTADDLNFYYGRLAAKALNLPQPPCIQKAEFMSLREATISLQVAHRRFSNLLHDLVPQDLERTGGDEQHGAYTLRHVIEMATAQYKLRTQQVKSLSAATARRRR